MAINVDSVENDVAIHIPFASRAQHSYLISVIVERPSFFPNTSIERDRQVFDNDENLFVHRASFVWIRYHAVLHRVDGLCHIPRFEKAKLRMDAEFGYIRSLSECGHVTMRVVT